MDPGCKGSNPSRIYPGRLTGTNLMAMMGGVNPLGVSTRGAQATTQIGDITEADLETWTENIIEITETITETIAEMIAVTIEGMIAAEEEDIEEVTETITDKIVEETPDVIAIIVIEARIEPGIDPGIGVLKL